MRQIFLAPGENLESAVYLLLAEKARGHHVYCEFNGHVLNSDDVTMDSAYLEVTGHKKEEYDQIMKQRQEEFKVKMETEQEIARKRVPEWIERGMKFIFPERKEKWEKCVKARSEDLYNGKDLDAALDIMEALEKGASMEEASKMFDDQNHSGMSASIVRRMVFDFSSQGPEFYEKTVWREIPPEDKKIIEARKAENAELVKKYSGKKM